MVEPSKLSSALRDRRGAAREVVPPHPGGTVRPVGAACRHRERAGVRRSRTARHRAGRARRAAPERRRAQPRTGAPDDPRDRARCDRGSVGLHPSDTATVPSSSAFRSTTRSRGRGRWLQGRHRQPAQRCRTGHRLPSEPRPRHEQDKGSQVQLLVSKGPAQVDGPNTVGVSETEARDRLAAVGLKANVVEVFARASRRGRCPGTERVAGGQGLEVRLNVSKGPQLVSRASSGSPGGRDCPGRGGRPRRQRRPRPSTDPAGTVVAQNPTGGQAERGSTVRSTSSRGRSHDDDAASAAWPSLWSRIPCSGPEPVQSQRSLAGPAAAARRAAGADVRRDSVTPYTRGQVFVFHSGTRRPDPWCRSSESRTTIPTALAPSAPAPKRSNAKGRGGGARRVPAPWQAYLAEALVAEPVMPAAVHDEHDRSASRMMEPMIAVTHVEMSKKSSNGCASKIAAARKPPSRAPTMPMIAVMMIPPGSSPEGSLWRCARQKAEDDECEYSHGGRPFHRDGRGGP